MTDEFFDTLKAGGVAGVLKTYRPVEEELEDANKLLDEAAISLEEVLGMDSWFDIDDPDKENVFMIAMRKARAVLASLRERKAGK